MTDPLLERYIQIINESDESTMTIDKNGNKIWCNKQGQFHRIDGPAVIWPDGTQGYYINDKLHREDGPAIIDSDGTKEYYINGKLHREDGPAVIEPNCTKEYWINGKQIAEDEFYANLVNKAIKVGKKK